MTNVTILIVKKKQQHVHGNAAQSNSLREETDNQITVHYSMFYTLNIITFFLHMIRLKKEMLIILVRTYLMSLIQYGLMYTINFLPYVAPNKVWVDASIFLEGLGRRIKVTRGDGNFLFRSISIIMCGNEDNH